MAVCKVKACYQYYRSNHKIHIMNQFQEPKNKAFKTDSSSITFYLIIYTPLKIKFAIIYHIIYSLKHVERDWIVFGNFVQRCWIMFEMIYSNMFENWVKAKDVFHGDFISLKIFCISNTNNMF